jgi:hypothetical protein
VSQRSIDVIITERSDDNSQNTCRDNRPETAHRHRHDSLLFHVYPPAFKLQNHHTIIHENRNYKIMGIIPRFAEFSPLGAPYQLKLGHQSALTGAANAALFFLFITARMNMLE